MSPCNTWKNDYLDLDIFTVEPPPEQLFEEERWQRVEKNLVTVLDGEMDLAAEMAKKSLIEKRGRRVCGDPAEPGSSETMKDRVFIPLLKFFLMISKVCFTRSRMPSAAWG